jgi:molybdopterin-guanine dinucleotide biosynthesis protein MobB
LETQSGRLAQNAAMRVVAFIGDSGSGKTTLIRALIEWRVAQGESVAAIKHTHHSLNDQQHGDTAAFFSAGARPVMLADDGRAVVHDERGSSRIAYSTPAELLANLYCDIVVIEGFKGVLDWPRLLVRRCTQSPHEVEVALASRDGALVAEAGAERLLAPTARELSQFVDRIWEQ